MKGGNELSPQPGRRQSRGRRPDEADFRDADIEKRCRVISGPSCRQVTPREADATEKGRAVRHDISPSFGRSAPAAA